jgi:hypothetical protein
MKPYKEIQRFNQWWVWVLLLVVFLSTIIPVITLSSENGFDTSFSWALVFPILLTLGAIILLYYLRLETTIDAQGIHYKFFPLPKKLIPWQEMEECYVRQYSPLREYGGWGIRFGFSGKAFNVKGNKGIQVKLKSGKKILFGTQNETEVKNVINAYKDYIK